MTVREVVDALHRTRNEQGLTQREVAARLGVARPTITQIENYVWGGRWHELLRRWADALGYELTLELRRRPCSHEGQLVEVPELREVRCEGCGEMAPTVEKHLREPG